MFGKSGRTSVVPSEIRITYSEILGKRVALNSQISRLDLIGSKSLFAMANLNQQQISIKPWILEVVPFIVLVLIAAHVIALVYWIYRLATEKLPGRRKKH
ncbi:unnamed protein product [Lactuca virosa]|uniref:Legume lectin domain-containing protein n=1 Tax=Lactuca virosa TaxID=75947 RepID=A0AAU9LN80_9ASTR|nr:unnamed protein product [Lactuca virosa]